MGKGRILSFKYAFEGIWTALKEEPNMAFHVLAMGAVIVCGLYFQINYYEWLAVTLTIGLVIALELANTAIETVVDSFTEEHHPGAKRAKDIASGSVLVMALTALIIGLLVFLPRFVTLLT